MQSPRGGALSPAPGRPSGRPPRYGSISEQTSLSQSTERFSPVSYFMKALISDAGGQGDVLFMVLCSVSTWRLWVL